MVFPRQKTHSRRLGNNTALLRSRSRSGVGGLEEWERGGRGASERREQPGRGQDSSSFEPKNAWAGSESNQDAGWSSGAWKTRDLEIVLKFPNSSLFPSVPALFARTSPAVSLYGLGGRLACRGPRISISSFPPFLGGEKGSTRGCVGRDGAGEGTTGRGWRRREKGRGGGGGYLFR